jgi:hypothetical protein
MMAPDENHEAFPVFENSKLVGTVSPLCIAQVPPKRWAHTRLRDVIGKRVARWPRICDVMEALRLLTDERRQTIFAS